MSRNSAESLKSLSPRRICIIKPSALGDIVQTLPLLSVLKDCYPEAEISWVINKGFANLLEDHPLIDKLMIFDRRGTVPQARAGHGEVPRRPVHLDVAAPRHVQLLVALTVPQVGAQEHLDAFPRW